jgi:hypothetical protein
MNRISRINNLMTRMLNNRDVSSDSANSSRSDELSTPTLNENSLLDNDNTLTTSTPSKTSLKNKEVGVAAVAPLSIKRNLFGMQLDHDQLKTDLNVMWKDQAEMKKQRWNFDFEKMKPVEATATANKNNNDMKWSKITVNYSNLDKEYEMTEAAISAAEITVAPAAHFRPIVNSKSSDEINIYRETTASTEKQVEDQSNKNTEKNESSSIPLFYQFQRRYKLNENKNRMNVINATNNVNTAPAKVTKNISINKPSANASLGLRPCTLQTTLTGCFNDQENAKNIVKPISTKASTSTTVRKPRALKRSNQLDSKSRIITFSENRKDTLRSASAVSSSGTLAASVTVSSSAVKQVNVVTQSTRSAFIPTTATSTTTTSSTSSNSTNMKQQSLLDMFKQRKPRKQNVDAKTGGGGLREKISPTSNDENARSGHFLRSQSATSQRY